MSDDRLELALDSTPFKMNDVDTSQDGFSFAFIVPSTSEIPPWWSASRDKYLRDYWPKVDILQVAVTTFISKVLSIPFSIKPVDANSRFLPLSVQITNDIMRNSGSSVRGPMLGWNETFSLFVQDYLTQDNGAHMFIMGQSKGDRPLVGQPIGLMHMDSACIQRTGNPEFPVLYHHPTDHKTYKLHYTRVISMAHIPSPISDMYGVGKCCVSGCLSASQELEDVQTYSAEKFGSRPARQILYAKTGATIENLNAAIAHWQAKLDAGGQTRFAGTLMVAPRSANNQLELELLDLSSTPDGFERRDVHLIDASTVAGAFGLDLLDFAIALGIQGQTRANADVQTRKGRGKGPGQFIDAFVAMVNGKMLPYSLEAVADTVDDDQDEQRANIADVRSQAYARHVQFSIQDVRSIRVNMLRDSEITRDTFERLELADGRLPDGTSVLALFESKDSFFLRTLGGIDPYGFVDEDAAEKFVLQKKREIWGITTNEKLDALEQFKCIQALAALDELEKYYEPEIGEETEKPPVRAINRNDLEGDEDMRRITADPLPEDNLMKEKFTPGSADLGWLFKPGVDPTSFTEEEIRRALAEFHAATQLDGILDA